MGHTGLLGRILLFIYDSKMQKISTIMKIQNIYTMILMLLLISACGNTEDPPMMMEPDVPFVWAESIDLEDFIRNNESGTITAENIVFKAQVVSSDEFGNLSDEIYVNRGNSTIVLELEEDNYFERYPMGSDILIYATGLNFNKDGVGAPKLSLAGGLTLEDEETYLNFIEERLAPTGRSVSDITSLTSDLIGTYVRIFALQFDEEVTGMPLTDGLTLSKNDGSSVSLVIEPGAQLVDEVPYGSGSIKGLLGQATDGTWTVRPMEPTDLTLTGTRFALFTMEEYVQDGFTLPYQIMYPKNYDPTKAYPFIVFLHGAGERGTNNTSQMANGPNTFANAEARNDYPAIVVFPQCPSNYMWSRRTKEIVNGFAEFTFPVEQEPDVPLRAVIQMTRDFIADGLADPERIYVLGLSMGGIGTLEYCYYAPDVPAAAISLAGGHDEDLAFIYGEEVSLRLFAGANDGVVPALYSQLVYDAVRFLPGADIEYYEDPNRGHEWNYILNDPTQVLPWLFERTKSD